MNTITLSGHEIEMIITRIFNADQVALSDPEVKATVTTEDDITSIKDYLTT